MQGATIKAFCLFVCLFVQYKENIDRTQVGDEVCFIYCRVLRAAKKKRTPYVETTSVSPSVCDLVSSANRMSNIHGIQCRSSLQKAATRA